MIGVHTGGFLPARVTANVVAAVERLGIEYPVVVDERLEIWDFYGNEGWPARYLWDAEGALYSLHYGEGAYQETEREIQALLGVERGRSWSRCAPRTPRTCCCRRRPRTSRARTAGRTRPAAPGPCSRAPARSSRTGARSPSRSRAAYPLVEHPHHTAGVLELAVGAGVTCHATCFTPGVAAPGVRVRPAGG